MNSVDIVKVRKELEDCFSNLDPNLIDEIFKDNGYQTEKTFEMLMVISSSTIAENQKSQEKQVTLTSGSNQKRIEEEIKNQKSKVRESKTSSFDSKNLANSNKPVRETKPIEIKENFTSKVESKETKEKAKIEKITSVSSEDIESDKKKSIGHKMKSKLYNL